MIVKFQPLDVLFTLPEKSFESDACFDIKARRIEYKDNLVICYLGFKTEIPEGWKGVIIPRSSITKTDWVIQNSPGTVDSHYRGEWQVRFKYIGDSSCMCLFPYNVGDRVAQIYFEKVQEVIFEIVGELEETQRGQGGFGSTGK